MAARDVSVDNFNSTDPQTPEKSTKDSDFESPDTCHLLPHSSIFTPTKRKLDFDFWNPDTTDKKLDSNHDCAKGIVNMTAVQINEGTLNFRVVLICARDPSTEIQSFSMHVIDNEGEIRIVAYKEKALECSKKFQLNSCYSITNFRVKPESAQYPSGTEHMFYIVIEPFTEIKGIYESEEIRDIPFKFINLNSIELFDKATKIDVLVVLVHDWNLETTYSGTIKRDLAITDESKATVNLTLWRNQAKAFSAEKYSVIAIRKARVAIMKDSQTHIEKKTLTAGADTLVWVNPTVKEALQLQTWFLEASSKPKV